MFTPEFFIDSFQTTKKILTNQVFKDATLNKAAHAYIDAQTVFAKMLTTNTLDITQYSVESVSKYFFPQEGKVSKAKGTKAESAAKAE